MQAMLNFSMAIVAARMTRAIVAVGLDPCFGFLHDGRKPGRLSLVWDCIEPLRPGVVSAVFEYASGKVFRKGDFAVSTEGIVRLGGNIAREVAELVIGKFPFTRYMKAVKIVERVL
jgi:CRISPR-associated protein Cas1